MAAAPHDVYLDHVTSTDAARSGAIFTALGTLWWLVPLLLLGVYSPPFLDYIETSAKLWRVTVPSGASTVNGVPRPADAEVHVSFPVQQTAWVVVGYPRYAPQITDMVTMDDTVLSSTFRRAARAPSLFPAQKASRIPRGTPSSASMRPRSPRQSRSPSGWQAS